MAEPAPEPTALGSNTGGLSPRQEGGRYHQSHFADETAEGLSQMAGLVSGRTGPWPPGCGGDQHIHLRYAHEVQSRILATALTALHPGLLNPSSAP